METSEIKETALYLTFMLEKEMFAVDVAQVREILDLNEITKVPNSPDFMQGIINVRGSVVPVVDLRMKFGLEKKENTTDTRIVVLELVMDDTVVVLGATADSVHEVLEIEAEHIEPPPTIGSRWRTDFIKGIGKRDEQFIIIIDIDGVFSSDELVLTGVTSDTQQAIEEETV